MTGRDGFTLIEAAVVLVIIGLIAGGVLAGQTLISAAAVRGTITQIEKFNTAANTFRDRTGYLPGDIPDPAASQFGLSPRGVNSGGTTAGAGDGNGILQGWWGVMILGVGEGDGENLAFWNDLSAMHLIEGKFKGGNSQTEKIPTPGVSGASIGDYLPEARMGRGNYVMTYSGGVRSGGVTQSNGSNYFLLSAVSAVTWTNAGVPTASGGLKVSEAYSIDGKIDDGLPTQGRELAIVTNSSSYNYPFWMNGDPISTPGDQTANTPSATTCYDNGGSANTRNLYSLNQNGGAGVNCALSFRFQ